MGKLYPEIDAGLAGFIAAQRIFFVGTAPAETAGRVNLSPKGADTFRILDSTTVGYLDLTGSGIETAAHVRENGRITFMFCAFDGAPKILRLYGYGEVIEPGDADFDALHRSFPPLEGARAIIRARIDRIADSCGYAVPLYRYEAERNQLQEWAQRKGPVGVVQYRAERNRYSIDGLPGLRGAGHRPDEG